LAMVASSTLAARSGGTDAPLIVVPKPSLDWLVEMEREEDWAREDKYDAAAFGVFMGSTGFSRFQGGLGEWGEWDEGCGRLSTLLTCAT